MHITDGGTSRPCCPGRVLFSAAGCSVLRVRVPDRDERAGAADEQRLASASDGDCREAEGTIADGTLQVVALPPPPDVVDEDDAGMHLALAIASADAGCSFFCLCPPGTVIHVAACECVLVVPDPEQAPSGPRTVCGIVFANGGLEDVATYLHAQGNCIVKWQANKEAHIAANATTFAGHFLAGVIVATSEVVGQGVRCAGRSALASELIPTRDAELPPAAKTGTQLAREASLKMANATGKIVSGLATVAGTAAAAAHEQLPECTEQWQQDAKVVGKSALEAGVTVWHAVQEATKHLAAEVADVSSELVGHRYGEEAGAATRDGFHAVGNVYAATTLLSVSGAGQMTAAGTAQGLAQSMDQACRPPLPATHPPPPPPPSAKDTLRRPQDEDVSAEEETLAPTCTEKVDDRYLGY